MSERSSLVLHPMVAGCEPGGPVSAAFEVGLHLGTALACLAIGVAVARLPRQVATLPFRSAFAMLAAVIMACGLVQLASLLGPALGPWGLRLDLAADAAMLVVSATVAIGLFRHGRAIMDTAARLVVARIE